MAFDTICVKKTVEELNSTIIGGRVDKIYLPEKDELMVSIRTISGSYKLVLSASANNARVHFSDFSKENPKTPPMFCMLLRKHLTSGKVVKVSQPNYERIIEIDIESYNELGDLTTKHLICEIMGRNSNVILCGEDYRIIDSAKHIDFSLSSVRQILPGLTYGLPPVQDKTPILDTEKMLNVTLDFSHDANTPDKAIMQAVSGISPATAREIVFSAIGTNSLVLGELSQISKNQIAKKKETILNTMEDGQVTKEELSNAASKVFKYGYIIWNSTNFYEFVFSNSKSRIEKFISYLPDAYVPQELIIEDSMVNTLW